jgi:hypothetical protein
LAFRHLHLKAQYCIAHWIYRFNVKELAFMTRGAARRSMKVSASVTRHPPSSSRKFYGLNADDAGYNMDSFTIVREHDEKAFGRFRTKEDVLALLPLLTA